MIFVFSLHCNQRLNLLLNLFARALSIHKDPYQALRICTQQSRYDIAVADMMADMAAAMEVHMVADKLPSLSISISLKSI